MKKVKTRKFLWAMLPMMAAALMTTACSSDDSTSVTPNPAADQTVKSIPYTVTVGQGTTTRATVANDDVTLQFADGDKLYVEDNSGNVYGCLTLKSGDAGKDNGATFSGDLYYTGDEPASSTALNATLVGASDKLANVSGDKVMGFENYPTTICATMAEAVQKYSKLTGSSTYGAKSFALSQETAFLKFSITLGGTTAGSDVSVVIKNGSSTIGTGTVTATGGTSVKANFVLALATGTTIAAGSTMNVGTKEIVYSSAGMTLSGGVYEYEGEVPGQGFTVNRSGKKVLFSPGNLQATYDGSSWTWAFAANQWDYIGRAAGNTSINGNGTVSASNVTVDLFGWVGKSSSWTGAAQYGISNSTATNNTNGYGKNAREALKSDWGNTISDGYTWFTLTSDEWSYLFKYRTSGSTVNSTSNARYTHATINTDGTGVNGMILFPDGITVASSEATSWGTVNGNSAWGTKCTTAQWSALAAKGCVFLPAAGYRSQASVSTAGYQGYYWSSSRNGVNTAYAVLFYSGYLHPGSYYNRNYGYSVRLVRQVE